MRQMYASNVGVKCWRQMLALNVGGFPKYMWQMLASNLCGIVKLLRHIIYDRNKVDVEISAPIKMYASIRKFASKLLLFGLGRISNF